MHKHTNKHTHTDSKYTDTDIQTYKQIYISTDKFENIITNTDRQEYS